MPLIEEISDHEDPGLSTAGGSAGLMPIIRELSRRLALPEDLLPAFMAEEKPIEAIRVYRDHGYRAVEQIRNHVRKSEGEWARADVDELAEVVLELVRLYGDEDPWTDAEIQSLIDEIVDSLPTSQIAVHLLSTHLRPIFSSNPHPNLNPSTARALSRPFGGAQALSDFSDSTLQQFKLPVNWGSYNVLSWCAAQLSPPELERRIGLVLPPTLILMDDWEPPWRGRGVRVLHSWIGKLDSTVMRRMGVDKLLINSLMHTLSLHADPPLGGVLGVTLGLVERTQEGRERVERYEEIMERALAEGWMYAKGRAVMCDLARTVEVMCGVLGVGIARWLKTIIPNLLQPLQFTPTAAVLPHYTANLSALLCVLRTLKGMSRIAKWRGQIMDMLARLWVQLGDRTLADTPTTQKPVAEAGLRDLIKIVLLELAEEYPQIEQAEYKKLVSLDTRVFSDLIPVTSGVA